MSRADTRPGGAKLTAIEAAARALDSARAAIEAAGALVSALDAGDERDMYTSANPPLRTSRRRFAEVCRSGRVDGARREGREWVCSREAWHAARTHAAPVKTTEPAAPPSLVERAENLLRRHGLRALPGGSR